MDTEQIQCKLDGRLKPSNVIARLSFLDDEGTIFDEYFKPSQKISNLITRISGIRMHNLNGKRPLENQ